MEKANFLLCLMAIAVSSILGSPTDDGRIVNGMEINIKQAPFMVRVLYGGIYCGGTLVAPKFVVTAAHCVYGFDVNEIIVVANVTSIDEDGIRRIIKRASVHPDYHYAKKYSDIALLELTRPIENIPTLKLCQQPLQEGDNIQVYGWGRIAENKSGSKILRTVSMPVRSQESCEAEYHNFVKQHMFCASGLEEVASCLGDSGGPAVFKGQLCGIVAFGYKCGEIGSQDVYTDVYAVKSFVEDIIGHE